MWFFDFFFVSDFILIVITEIQSAKNQCHCCVVQASADQFAVLCWDLVIGVSRTYNLPSHSLGLFRTSL